MCDNSNTSFIANIFFFHLKLILLIHTSPIPTFILRIQCALVRPKPKYILTLNYAVQKNLENNTQLKKNLGTIESRLVKIYKKQNRYPYF